MTPDDLVYPAVYFDGRAYFLERADRCMTSRFGGPMDYDIEGIAHGPRRLHHVLTLAGDCFEPLQNVVGADVVQLPYGFSFGGSSMSFETSWTEVNIKEMATTQSSPDWPYPDYPAILPYFPLRLQQCIECTVEGFSEVSCQPLSADPAEAIVIVPPSPLLGMSLWGPSGDAECVQIVFRWRMEVPFIVTVENQCG